MRQHLTEDDLSHLRSGEWSADEILAGMRHLDQCAECSSVAQRGVDVDAEGARLVRDIAPRALLLEHPDLESALRDFVDDALPPDEREMIEEHVAGCDVCAADVADLRDVRREVRRARSRSRYSRWFPVAASVLLLVALAAWLVGRWNRPPSPSPRASIGIRPVAPPTARPRAADRELRPEWNQLVEAALSRGSVEVSPQVAELRGVPDNFRGEASAVASVRMRPAGEVVETARPRFTWPAGAPGSRYIVSVVADDREVARSPRIVATDWRPPVDLPSDRALTWQVTVVRSGGAADIIPAPPDPPARFRVLSDAARREIEEARRLHPGDHLLMGLLNARNGLLRAAEEELAAYAAQHPDNPVAQRLLRSVRQQRNFDS